MDDRSISTVKVIGMVCFIMLGLVFHDLYEITGNTYLGIISPVNESKWEHWKMAFFPVLIVSLFEYRFIKAYASNYIISLAVGILVFLIITFGSIELYDIFIGYTPLFIHVSTFLLGGIACQMIRYYIILRTKPSKTFFVSGYAILLILFVLFAVFTFLPPKTQYFRDPLTDTYGIHQVSE